MLWEYDFFSQFDRGGVPMGENVPSAFGGQDRFVRDDVGLDTVGRLVPTHVSRVLGVYTVTVTALVTSIPGTVFVLFLGKHPTYDTLVFGWISFESD